MAMASEPPLLLVVSPHLDDAVLSVGGHLYGLSRAGFVVRVATVFAGSPAGELSPLAREHHQRFGLQRTAVDDRRREDADALTILGAELVHGPFLDAIYRRHPSGSWLCRSWDDVFNDRLVDLATTRDVAAWLDGLASERRPWALFAPSGIGQHVDHLLTLRAARAVAGSRGWPLWEWWDLPYAIDDPPGTDDVVEIALSDAVWARKREAVLAYRTQAPYLRRYDDSDLRVERLREITSSRISA